MVSKVGPTEQQLQLKFGGGLHTRASEDEIDPREAASGVNFVLDLENRELRPRPPFDLVGRVPNTSEIRGGGSLLKTDGTVKAFIQAGAAVYEWDGSSGFVKIATVSASSKLRGHWRSHNFQLDDKLLITDLELVEVVKEWDGTTFQDVSFVSGTAGSSGSPFGTFYAKYCTIVNERAVFAHVRDPSQISAHMIVGSQQSEYTIISNGQKPSSALSLEDPFFMVTPDLKAINGLLEAFGTMLISTEKGKLFALGGNDATDFRFDEFYAGSAAAGEEALAYCGNDVMYGRQGRIESVRDTDRFGDSEADDVSAIISDRVQSYTGWRIVYNSRLNRTYCFPDEISECWTYNVALRGGQLSPWVPYTTTHRMAFRPTFVASMLDPSDGLEYIILGDAQGYVYRMEGSGQGDGGVNAIQTEFLSRLFSAPVDMETFNIEGYLKYRKAAAFDVGIKFEFAGRTAYNETVTVAVPALSGGAYFGGNYYFGGDVFFGIAFENRLLRQHFDMPGQSNEFQVRVSIETLENFSLNEIGLRFVSAG